MSLAPMRHARAAVAGLCLAATVCPAVLYPNAAAGDADMPLPSDVGGCARPVSTGATPTASDCLFILRAAVGLDVCTLACICDANGDVAVTATDALVCLSVAVGNDVTLACSCVGSTTTTIGPTTTTTRGTRRLGACCAPVTRRIGCVVDYPTDCIERGGVYLGDRNDLRCSVEDQAACAEITTTTISTTTTSTTTSTTTATSTTTSTTTATSTTTSTTTVPTGDRVGACCVEEGCVVVPPEECSGSYLGDRDDRMCSPADVLSCVLGRVLTIPTTDDAGTRP